MGLTCQLPFSSNSHNYIWEKYSYFSHITAGKIEVQRGQGTCPRTHSWKMVKTGFNQPVWSSAHIINLTLN